jgi:putative ABC transport system substrate-binding protein
LPTGLTADPVAIGLAASVARPGGNVAGATIDGGLEITGKRFRAAGRGDAQTVRRSLPCISTILGWTISAAWREAAKPAGVSLSAARQDAFNDAEYQRTFKLTEQDPAEALMVSSEPELLTDRATIVELAAKGRIPTIYPLREFVEVGGLMAYSIDPADVYRRLPNLIDKILRGANPGDSFTNRPNSN